MKRDKYIICGNKYLFFYNKINFRYASINFLKKEEKNSKLILLKTFLKYIT